MLTKNNLAYQEYQVLGHSYIIAIRTNFPFVVHMHTCVMTPLLLSLDFLLKLYYSVCSD